MKVKFNMSAASSSGKHFNSGNGPTIQLIDIGHSKYIGLVDPDTAFWALIKKDKIGKALADSTFMRRYQGKISDFSAEMQMLRFGLMPTAVYFNPTERCNLNCNYCYIPENMRKDGKHMSERNIIKALGILQGYFKKTITRERLPQIIFHGSEPMLNRNAIFTAIDKYKNSFLFGVQTNGTLLDDEAVEFLTSRGVSIGLSLDGHTKNIADAARRTWAGDGIFEKVIYAIKKLEGYQNYSVICTVARHNMKVLPDIINYFHSLGVPYCMLNPIRCTLQGSINFKPQDYEIADYYLKALDRAYELYLKTGRKIIIANFANVLVSIIAPTARRLMCDISPCGGGRCFFAVSAKGDLFPCSEFIGLAEFCGGNIFSDEIKSILNSHPFKKVTGRKVENFEPCSRCSIRQFCGAPCPAEANELNGGINCPGAFCELYEEQVRYAMRLIADGKENAYLWDNWDLNTSTSIKITTFR